MSPEPLQDLRGSLDRARNASVVVAAGGEGDDTLTLQRLNLHEDVADDFLETAKRAVLPDAIQKPYDPGYKPEPEELCIMPLEDEVDIAEVIATISAVDSIELFDADDDVVDSLRFYAVVVGSSGRRAVFFRSYSPKKELTRRGGFALMMRAGTYNRVANKIFLFDELIDCFAWGGVLYIRNPVQFQRIFGYFERLRDRADETLQRVAQHIPVSNLDDLRDACRGSTLMAAKLAAIAKKPYLSRVTMDDVKRTITEFTLPIETRIEGGREKLVFDSTREGRWRILKLLDDDYLGSVMTREKYEVNSKTRV